MIEIWQKACLPTIICSVREKSIQLTFYTLIRSPRKDIGLFNSVELYSEDGLDMRHFEMAGHLMVALAERESA